MQIGDAQMGEEVAGNGPATISVEVEGTAPIQTIDILRDATVVHSINVAREHASLDWTDREPRSPGVTTAYWVRVVQTNGEEAVSSPIWWKRN